MFNSFSVFIQSIFNLLTLNIKSVENLSLAGEKVTRLVDMEADLLIKKANIEHSAELANLESQLN